MGRVWLAKLKLNWRKVHQLSSSDVLQLLTKYSFVFKEELGTLKCLKAKIHVREGVKPNFFKPRNVPYVMKAKLEEELKRLEESNIITPYNSLSGPLQ